MTKNLPDERVVYLALKDFFKGADGQIRKAKKVREVVQKAQHNIDVRDLIQQHNFESICSVTKALLEQQIFESTLKAKIRFPEVFEISPAQSAERSASEVEAARLEADAVKSASAGHNKDIATGDSDDVHWSSDKVSRAGWWLSRNARGLKANIAVDLYELRTSSRKRPFPHTSVQVPSLYPVYLPYQTQHRLLLKVQGILEDACYNFGSREMKDVIEKEGWDCAECVELNVWARTLLANKNIFQLEDLESLGQQFSELTSSINHLRHTVVHRLRINANGLERFLADAEALAQLLHDDYNTRSLARLRREAQISIDELKRNKDLLESRLNSKLKKISDQRIEIDQLEQSVVDEMLKADKEYQLLAGSNLDEAIQAYDTAMQSPAPTDTVSRPESDFEDDPA
ncbi:uncharacterized protein A1O9_05168 [Exophiala aquamarina CBS 119918]|uniref:Ubiquinol-cytochrome-c reductase cytochrome c1 n=1 Tax=Exophiala aquamarina CBS 119918 TaxID=1182545 RepID=A0A072PBM8_9EURO|nr:uncharacterized protein A1O9_05168 [Exophiala aquamarina CBS 119918]KEF57251.1 hypothetical protein A1O9_05168 [Exophiala aquamarina CBS 119918]